MPSLSSKGILPRDLSPRQPSAGYKGSRAYPGPSRPPPVLGSFTTPSWNFEGSLAASCVSPTSSSTDEAALAIALENKEHELSMAKSTIDKLLSKMSLCDSALLKSEGDVTRWREAAEAQNRDQAGLRHSPHTPGQTMPPVEVPRSPRPPHDNTPRRGGGGGSPRTTAWSSDESTVAELQRFSALGQLSALSQQLADSETSRAYGARQLEWLRTSGVAEIHELLSVARSERARDASLVQGLREQNKKLQGQLDAMSAPDPMPKSAAVSIPPLPQAASPGGASIRGGSAASTQLVVSSSAEAVSCARLVEANTRLGNLHELVENLRRQI